MRSKRGEMNVTVLENRFPSLAQNASKRLTTLQNSISIINKIHNEVYFNLIYHLQNILELFSHLFSIGLLT